MLIDEPTNDRDYCYYNQKPNKEYHLITYSNP